MSKLIKFPRTPRVRSPTWSAATSASWCCGTPSATVRGQCPSWRWGWGWPGRRRQRGGRGGQGTHCSTTTGILIEKVFLFFFSWEIQCVGILQKDWRECGGRQAEGVPQGEQELLRHVNIHFSKTRFRHSPLFFKKKSVWWRRPADVRSESPRKRILPPTPMPATPLPPLWSLRRTSALWWRTLWGRPRKRRRTRSPWWRRGWRRHRPLWHHPH